MEITNELAQDIKELIKDSKLDVRKGVLNVLLACCADENNRYKLKESDVIKYFLRYMKEDQLETASLSNLINFSQDEFFQQQFVTLNAIDKVFEYLKEILQENNQQAEKQQLIIQLLVLLLLNMSKTAPLNFLTLGENKEKEGRNILYLLKMLSLDKNSFKYFPNILANLTSQKQGRVFLLQNEYQLLETILPYLLESRRIIRLGSMKTIRNCAFEYESITTRILSKDLKFIETINKYQSNILIQSKFLNLTEDQKQQLKNHNNNVVLFDNQEEITNANQELEEIYLSIDVLLVLTNINIQEFDYEFDKNLFTLTINTIKSIESLSEEAKDQIQVLETLY